jgi:aminoglycoside phosphotransferase (APT) family kinase protein
LNGVRTTARGPRGLRYDHWDDRILHVERAQWGFATPTRILTLASGKRVVIQVVPLESGRLAPAAARGLGNAGVPAPSLIARRLRNRSATLVWAYVAGTAGASLMDQPAAATVAREMGRVNRAIRAIRDPEFPTDEAWRSPRTLRVASETWAASLASNELRDAATASVDSVLGRQWRPALTHGDFVPANVLISVGRISAVLDLGDVSYRHPLLDAAWWSFIVAHHHEATYPRLEPLFLSGAELPVTDELLRRLAAIAAVRALQLVAMQPRSGMELGLLTAALRRANSLR